MSDSEQPDDTRLETSRTHPEEECDSSLPSGTVERILSDRRRRELCQYLSDARIATMDELIDLLVRGGCTHETALIRLHHVHLPMLEEFGILAYEKRSETVRYWGHESVERRLDLCQSISGADGTERSDDAADYPRTRT